MAATLHKEQRTSINRAAHLLWWHINAITWGKSAVAEYVAKLKMWLLTPPSSRGYYAPDIEAITRNIIVAPSSHELSQ